MLQCNRCERRGCPVMANSGIKPWNESGLRTEYRIKGSDGIWYPLPSWWHRIECKRHIPINNAVTLLQTISKITIENLNNPALKMMEQFEISKGTKIVVKGGN